MKPAANVKGRVVESLAGHDRGRLYAVLDWDDQERLLLTDGEKHPLNHPKPKKIKHVRTLPETVAVEGKGGSGGPVTDGDIRKALSELAKARGDKEENTRVQE